MIHRPRVYSERGLRKPRTALLAFSSYDNLMGWLVILKAPIRKQVYSLFLGYVHADGDFLGSPMINVLRDCLDLVHQSWKITGYPVMICGITNESSKLPPAFVALFKHEIIFEVNSPSFYYRTFLIPNE